MTRTYNICLLPGDGIGPESIAEGVKVLDAVGAKYDTAFSYTEALLGGCAIDACGTALPDETLRVAESSDAVLLAAVGGPKWDTTDPCWASARRWACTRTCVPCRSSPRWPTRPPSSPRSWTAWT